MRHISISWGDYSWVYGVLLLAFLLMMAPGGLRPTLVQADDFSVISANNSGTGSLRAAVTAANTTPGADTITIDAGVGLISLTGSELSITDDLTIVGQGISDTVISGNDNSRVFNIDTGVTVTIQNLTLENGRATDDNGGAILNAGTLTLENVVVRNSIATFDGGGIANTGALTLTNSDVSGNSVVLDFGGGIYSAGDTVSLASTTLDNNTAPKNGGGLYLLSGSLNVNGGTMSGNEVTSNTSGQGLGGGFFLAAETSGTVTNATLQNNTAQIAGGGVFAESNVTLSFTGSVFQNNLAANPLAEGGGIWSDGTLTLANTTFQANRSNFQGGGLFNNRNGVVTITDSTFQENRADEGAGIFNERESGQITISGSRFANNIADTTDANGLSGDGGAIYSFREARLTISDTQIVDNQAGGDGAGIYSEGELTLTNVLVQNNETIDVDIDNDATGGGIYLGQRSNTVIRNSQILSNTARGPGGGIARLAPVAELETSLTIENTTISGNEAQTDAPDIDNKLGGGGLLLSAQVELTNVTIINNTAAAGGGIFVSFDDITLTNVTVANNTARAVSIPAPIGGGTETDPDSGLGGGIFVSAEPSSLTINTSAIYNNSAEVGGGGLFLGSPLNSLTNVTISGNTAPDGGAIFKTSFGIESLPGLELASVTIANNSATAAEGVDGLLNLGGFVGLRSTILANGDGATNCGGMMPVVTSLGYNIDSGTSCDLAAQEIVGDLSNSDPLLEPLSDNGGPTLTHGLTSGSPALNANGSAAEFCPAIDQRGTERPQGAGCDIGAFEFSPTSDVSVGERVFLPVIVR